MRQLNMQEVSQVAGGKVATLEPAKGMATANGVAAGIGVATLGVVGAGIPGAGAALGELARVVSAFPLSFGIVGAGLVALNNALWG